MKRKFVWGVALLFSIQLVPAQTEISENCTVTETVCLLATTDTSYLKPISELSRIEICRCGPDDNLLIKAWSQRGTRPDLLIDTSDFSVVQTFARENVFIIVTGGGPRNRVYVITYEDGKPRLALKRVTRGNADLSVAGGIVRLVINGIFAGDDPPRTETHEFRLK